MGSQNNTGAEMRISHLSAPDGTQLTVRDWPLAGGAVARATVLIVHGLGEHSGRYAALAQQLNGWGFAVRGYDQFGHGLSGGARGALSSDMRLLDDLAGVIDATRAAMPRDQPLVLLGHSLGGLVASDFVAAGLRHVDALVLSSPALALHLSGAQKALIASLPKLLPNLRVTNGVQSRHLSHDPAVVKAYDADPLQHNRISARLARYVAEGGLRVQGKARNWCVPTLLLWAGQDKLVDPAGSQAFAEHVPAHVLQAQCFEEAYHEIFNESTELAAPVLARLRAWLDQQFPAA
ncbi:lysophospholipase [Comamonas testosteroni]|uniref:Lysophospholipase n=1 Tax=Comamonas testosteroni TaxID=285 RepID=A0A373FLP9_COMTE|nr:alpha/beta hydrolase [Comamonas testosteroni]RGE44877.1 lysophospholipase [Comamonas testosteroni]